MKDTDFEQCFSTTKHVGINTEEEIVLKLRNVKLPIAMLS